MLDFSIGDDSKL